MLIKDMLSKCDHIATLRHYKGIVPFRHDGIYLGDGKVVHYGTDENGNPPIKVQIVSLKAFCKGNLNNLMIIPHLKKRYTEEQCMKRVAKSLGGGVGKYDFKKFNCEHYVEFILTNKPVSNQSQIIHDWKKYKQRMFG